MRLVLMIIALLEPLSSLKELKLRYCRVWGCQHHGPAHFNVVLVSGSPLVVRIWK